MELREPGSTLRILRPSPYVVAFYDGRLAGVRLHSERENWLDDGAFGLGICSYAVIDGPEALVFDTHVSLAHGRIIRRTLEEMGAASLKVLLSHWHDDHVAGNGAFADCEIISNALTAQILAERRAEMEAADPPIKPLVLPNRTFRGGLSLVIGSIRVEAVPMDVHSRDGTVLRLPGGLLLAGDTLEDPITYVDEPDRLAIHLEGLGRMESWKPARILPAHGRADIIAAGGYGPDLITANRLYVEQLLRLAEAPERAALDLEAFAADAFATGAIAYFSPYEAVHRRNVAAVLAATAR